ncbi:MAG: glycosyl hydrolase family 59 [Oscillospiraceae bacterium]
MGKYKRIFAAAVCMTMLVPTAAQLCEAPVSAEGLERDIVIDGDKANTAENKLFRGQGLISANNSSRLLMDYKTENPDKYWEIMNYIFGEEGMAMTHLKVEMGADINSSSGTEPAVKRTEDEPADVTRGAAYQLAADAKSINPDITLDMLWWSEPLWVSNASDVYAARYKWYKETLDAAYNVYGLEFDYVGAVQNERGADTEWIKYLAKHLDEETDCPYDYSQIKIVAGDEVCTWQIADKMLKDEELLNAIDVVGSHYTSWASANARKLADEYGKELWFSEASPSMSYSKGNYRYDGKNSGLADIGGVLDVANRIITMYPGGEMTLYEYQPVVAAYYDGVTYCSKQLIKAAEPWSGAYELDSGFYMSLHFSQFIKKGWAFVDDACYADGSAGGDGHAIVNSTYSYMTASDTETDDYSTVITNTTGDTITYNFTVTNLDKADDTVYVWETRGPDGGSYDENYFRKISEITPNASDNTGEYTYSVTLKPYSMITVSTLDVPERTYSGAQSQTLALPYSDDYEYSDYSSDYLSSRGNMPRYTTDEGGAFEVRNVDGNNVVMHIITPDIKAKEWGSTPNPTTNFGDDRWFNYSVSADVCLSESDKPSDNYAGVGLRYNLGANGASGYWAKLCEDGTLYLMRNKMSVDSVSLSGVSAGKWVNLKIEAVQDTVKVYADGELKIEYVSSGASVLSAGRAAYFSSYNNNCFDNFKAEPIETADTSVVRYDDMDGLVSYSGSWAFTTTGSYKSSNRTSSKGSAGAKASFSFEGTGFAITGESAKDAVISVTIDGKTYEATTLKSGIREISYYKYGLESGAHDVEIEVISGTYNIDGIEIIEGDSVPAEFGTESDEPSDSSSEADSSSEESSISDNSESTASGTESVSSSSADTSTSSAAESHASSSSKTSSSQTTSASDKTPNPATGALAGGLAAVLALGALAVVKTKNK